MVDATPGVLRKQISPKHIFLLVRCTVGGRGVLGMVLAYVIHSVLLLASGALMTKTERWQEEKQESRTGGEEVRDGRTHKEEGENKSVEHRLYSPTLPTKTNTKIQIQILKYKSKYKNTNTQI